MNLRNIAINSTLALTGVALWSYGASRLASGGDFNFEPNPLGLKASPYGQVIALAMQGGIESDWHGTTHNPTGHVCKSCGHHHGDSGACHSKKKKPEGFLKGLELAVSERTNPRPATEGHKFYLRRQAEDKLKLAYELDPSNYANYNSYHLFLTEPAVGTRKVLTNQIIDLAAKTYRYGMHEPNDPRPALTAAAAAGNILELMFIHRESYTIQEMENQLACMEQAISRHQSLAVKWIESGEIGNLSAARQQEMLDRLHFVAKVREAAVETIRRLSSVSPDQVSLSR
jgi:hypothetical protein